jgi:branched-chain amino acid transport system substrate-binding protein
MQNPQAPEPDSARPWRLRSAAVLAALLLVVGAACSSDDSSSDDGDSADTTADAASVLGEPNPASGEPVKVGFISDGRTASIDNSAMQPAGEATVDYANEYMGGIAGRPIELVTCETAGEPGKATDCANEVVQEGVVMTIMPETIQPAAVHTVLSANGIPLFVYGVTEPAITEDAENAFMFASLTGGLSALPIDVAEQNDLDRVTVFVVDVPAATEFYEGLGAEQFQEADIELEVVKIPLGAPDISQQVNQVVTGDPTVVHIVGDAGLCIAAINGLATNGFEGPITVLNNCVTDAVKEATGSNIEDVVMASPTPIGDESNPGIQLWEAILAEYDPGYEDPTLGLTTFITTYTAIQALGGLTGEVTTDAVRETIQSAPEMELVTGAGLGFRCNGQAAPATPAVCTRGTLRVTLDADGEPILPYEAVGNSPIPD